ncbi:MAG: DNA repair protein RecN [Clostridia bacterium]|nr:DNA repair protein RecN [Clostridia bacterium]
MLQSLTIRNIALIDELTIELGNGFNVLTGETGAGKSLIIDSLALLLGEKADKGLISYGKEFASVEAVFQTDAEDILSKMEEFGLERENTIIIYRKLSLDGKNECRVNGKSFTLSMLKMITSPLMDLHGQFQHQELLKQSVQLKTLDEFGVREIGKIKNEFKEIFYKLKQVNKQLKSYNFDSKDREKLLDMYSFQINEIEEAHFVSGEEEELKEFRMKVLNQEKIIDSLKRSMSFFGDSGLTYQIKRLEREFDDVVKYLPEKNDLLERISSIKYEIEDIENEIESASEDLYFDEFSAAQNEKRLDLLSSLKKKYGSSVDEINLYLDKIKIEYEKLQNSAEIVEKLEIEREKLINLLKLKANELTETRKNIAEIFVKKVKENLAELSMKSAKFEIVFEQLDETSCDENGFDKIEFMFTANSGQPLKPLSKVASGGEMSRFMLSVKNVTADIVSVDTMIFDEIDTGISGDTANALAVKLASIGKNHQVICVTHLAQVASFGSTHFFISKFDDNGKTKTQLNLLIDSSRVAEIARLIGGNISDFSLSHAKLMLESGYNFNQNT